MPVVNHAFARVTPAIFVVFVVFTGSEKKALVLQVTTQIRHFAVFVKTLCLAGDKGTVKRFTKGTIFWASDFVSILVTETVTEPMESPLAAL